MFEECWKNVKKFVEKIVEKNVERTLKERWKNVEELLKFFIKIMSDDSRSKVRTASKTFSIVSAGFSA